MILRYGNYTHEANEAALQVSKRALNSEAGVQYGWEETWAVSGSFFGADPAAIAAGMTTMERAYARNGADFYLLDDSGNVLRFMKGRTPLGATRILNGVEFPENGEKTSEFTSWRTYRIQIQGRYPITGHATNAVLAFTETLSFEGGGPLIVHLELLDELPQKQMPRRFTTYRAIQQGSAVGLYGYPPVPLPLWPGALVKSPTPNRHSPKREGDAFTEFRIDWVYYFESATPLLGNPGRPPL